MNGPFCYEHAACEMPPMLISQTAMHQPQCTSWHLIASCFQVMAGAGAEARAARLQHLDDLLDMPHPEDFDQVLSLAPPLVMMCFLLASSCGWKRSLTTPCWTRFACPDCMP